MVLRLVIMIIIISPFYIIPYRAYRYLFEPTRTMSDFLLFLASGDRGSLEFPAPALPLSLYGSLLEGSSSELRMEICTRWLVVLLLLAMESCTILDQEGYETIPRRTLHSLLLPSILLERRLNPTLSSP